MCHGMLHETVEQKDRSLKTLVQIHTMFAEKYMKKLFAQIEDKESQHTSEKVLFKKFQKKLSDIASWSDGKKDKEYQKLLVWCRKRFDISEKELEKHFDRFIQCALSILLYHHDHAEISEKLRHDDFLDIKQATFKSIKRVARAYYDEPSLVYTNATQQLQELVSTTLHSSIPTKAILKLIEERQTDSTKASSSADQDLPPAKLVVEKEGSEQHVQLRLVPSEDAYNEYYYSEDSKEQHVSQDKKSSELAVKHVTLPMNNKKYTPYVTNNRAKKKDDYFSD